MDTDLLKQAAANISGSSDPIASLTPEEKADVPVQMNGIKQIQLGDAQGKDARTQLYESIQNIQAGLKDDRADILQRMSQDAPMSKSQVAAMMLIGILPTIVGGAIKGKKGIAKGAEAGALGAQVMAKGMEGERTRNEARLKTELETVDKQLASTGELYNKAKLDEINAADTAREKGLDRQATLGAAAIRAGGEASGLKQIAAEIKAGINAFKLEKAGQESNANKQSFSFGGKVYANTGNVKQEQSDAVREAGKAYATALESIEDAIRLSKGADFPMLERMVGDKSDKMFKLYGNAKNAIAELKKIPGLKGTESFTALEGMVASPTNWANNLLAFAPATADVEQQLANTTKVMQKDWERLMKFNGYGEIPVGQIVKTKDGKQIRITGVAPDGGLTYESIE